jgi:hypothetical protein
MSLPPEYGKSDENGSRFVSVTPIDANHIKGSVMYLFEGKIKYYIYFFYITF